MRKILLLIVLLFPTLALAQDVVTHTKMVTNVLNIETSQYTANDVVGELLTLTGAARTAVGSGIIGQVALTDADGETVDMDVIYFKANPTGTTVTDNSPLTVADADLAKIICRVSLTNHTDFVNNGFSQAQNSNCLFNSVPNSTIYAVVITRATVTFTASTDLTLITSVYQD